MYAPITVNSLHRRLCDWHSANVYLDSLGSKYQARFAKRQMQNAMYGYLRNAALQLGLPVVLEAMSKCLSEDEARCGDALTKWYRHQGPLT